MSESLKTTEKSQSEVGENSIKMFLDDFAAEKLKAQSCGIEQAKEQALALELLLITCGNESAKRLASLTTVIGSLELELATREKLVQMDVDQLLSFYKTAASEYNNNLKAISHIVSDVDVGKIEEKAMSLDAAKALNKEADGAMNGIDKDVVQHMLKALAEMAKEKV